MGSLLKRRFWTQPRKVFRRKVVTMSHGVDQSPKRKLPSPLQEKLMLIREKNKLKRKRQAEKKKAKKIKLVGDINEDICETENNSDEKKEKKFYNPESKHNNKSAAQIERFKKKYKNPNKKLSK